MKFAEKTGKTVEEAVKRSGSIECYGRSGRYQVLEEPNKGFSG